MSHEHMTQRVLAVSVVSFLTGKFLFIWIRAFQWEPYSCNKLIVGSQPKRRKQMIVREYE
jgi:uncharacterized membrane protein YdcZ (DUF606 family)